MAKSRKQLFDFCLRFSFNRFRHQRRRCLRNCATFTFKTDIANDVVLEIYVNLPFAPAQRIETFSLMPRVFEPSIVSRPATVIDNQFLIEIRNFDIVHNSFLTGCALSAYGKKLLQPANTVCQSIQFRFRVIQRQRRSGRCRDTKPFHDGLRTVMSGPDGDAVAIEDGADVMWMHALEHKRKHANFFASSADHSQSWDRSQQFCSIGQQSSFVSTRAIDSDSL